MSGPPATIGRFQIVSKIGRGGMGTLYLAWDPKLERQIAIKILIEDDDELRERFAREARSAARLRHPNIVIMYDVGEDNDGRPFIAMEYIQGHTLAEIIRKGEVLTTVRKLQLIESLVEGLAFAHRAGVIHRDVKPANIMVDASGALKILDFGIARIAEASGITRAGAQLGSLNYMSPEQLIGQSVDHRSDIFAVGAVCYELFSSRQAFPGTIETGVLHKLLHGQPEPLATLCPTLDPEIVRIVQRCLEVDVQARYQDLDSTLKDFARVRARLASQPSPEPADRPGSGPERLAAAPSGRRLIDLEELARRRADQIQKHLKTAVEAQAAGDYDAAIAECERVLMIDADHGEALELLDRAKTALDEGQAEQFLTEAEGDIERGALTAAVSKIDQAAALSPASARAAQVRTLADEAVGARARQRERTEAVRVLLERAHGCRDTGAFADAVAAVDEALTLDPSHVDAKTLRTQLLEALEIRAREEHAQRARECVRDARRRFVDDDHRGALEMLERFEPEHTIVTQALVELRAESIRTAAQRQAKASQRTKQQRIDAALTDAKREIERGEFADALVALQALVDAEGSSPDISALVKIAEAGQAELDRTATRARSVAGSVAKAAGLFARNDCPGALARIDQALALDPKHGPAQALRAKVQARMRAADERSQAREQRTREREQAIADALARARRAASHQEAIEALSTALDMDPAHAEARRLLSEREERVAREQAERLQARAAERARRARIDELLASAREAMRRDDIAGARRVIRKVQEQEADNLDAQWLLGEMAAAHGEPLEKP